MCNKNIFHLTIFHIEIFEVVALCGAREVPINVMPIKKPVLMWKNLKRKWKKFQVDK